MTDAERKALLEVIEDLVLQFGIHGRGPTIGSGGLSTLEDAFDALGWDDPHPVPEACCDEPGCEEWATCGWPSPQGYRRTCGDHMSREFKP